LNCEYLLIDYTLYRVLLLLFILSCFFFQTHVYWRKIEQLFDRLQHKKYINISFLKEEEEEEEEEEK